MSLLFFGILPSMTSTFALAPFFLPCRFKSRLKSSLPRLFFWLSSCLAQTSSRASVCLCTMKVTTSISYRLGTTGTGINRDRVLKACHRARRTKPLLTQLFLTQIWTSQKRYLYTYNSIILHHFFFEQTHVSCSLRSFQNPFFVIDRGWLQFMWLHCHFPWAILRKIFHHLHSRLLFSSLDVFFTNWQDQDRQEQRSETFVQLWLVSEKLLR